MKCFRAISESEIEDGYVRTELENGEELYRVFSIGGAMKVAYTAAHEFAGEFESTLKLVAYENGVTPDDVDVALMYG